MTAFNYTLSSRLKKLFDAGELDKTLVSINKNTAKYILGRHRENIASRSAPFRKGFTPWQGVKNGRTLKYKPYKDWYADEKIAGKHYFWHKVSGALETDAIFRPTVTISPRSISFTIARGGSRKYAATQQYGLKKMNVPPRPYYAIDSLDRKNISVFYQKYLAHAFGKGARMGTINTGR